ncbi:hypothetical protein NA57DRAFT_78907 [Rhizodiscina lignyota]|uniref:Uncharacterized protein n=1 Tax=Rhizodiscina lignyota TaxID=1504668 RepID=A0A9P4IDB2_9PEZI|nr:hypothetical protein NA57DRAFT_78907 [Rhizodiscina lignyota]
MFHKLHIYLAFALSSVLRVHAGIQWDNIYNSCGAPSDTQQGGAAILSDMVNMAKAAGGYMDNAQANRDAPDQSKHWDYYRVLTLYDALFDGTQPDSQNRWNTVRANLNTMEGLANNQPDVWVSCDDTTLFGMDTVGSVSRTYFKDPSSKAKTYLDNPPLMCGQGQMVNGQMTNQIGYRTTINGINLVIICAKQAGGDITLSQLQYQEGSDLYMQTTLSTVVFHEFLHVMIPSMVGDQAGGNAPGGERYGWDGSIAIRSSYSPQNPDSLVYFAMALSMEEYLWHTGKAVSLPTMYQWLQQNQQTTLQSAGLPKP